MLDPKSENQKFGLSDSEIEKILEEANKVSFYGNKVASFNERELRIAIGCLARIIIYEQNRMLNLVTFSNTTLENINYKLPERSALRS